MPQPCRCTIIKYVINYTCAFLAVSKRGPLYEISVDSNMFISKTCFLAANAAGQNMDPVQLILQSHQRPCIVNV